MPVADTIAALQVIHAAISGVKSAPASRPVERFNASLPCVLVRPGALAVSPDGRGSVSKVRAYEGVALVTPPNQGRGVSEGVAKVAALMDAFEAAYESLIEGGATLSTGGMVIGYRDGGEPGGLLSYAADDFEGFTFTVEVWEG